MLCYKDMMFCNAEDCAVTECRRNRRGSNFTPDEFWKDKVCIGDIKQKCKEYKKEKSMSSNKCENCGREFAEEDVKFDIEGNIVCLDCADSYARETCALFVTDTTGVNWQPCGWCGELFPQESLSSECSLGNICTTCTMGIMSRGENLCFTVRGEVNDVD